jgi:ELWxxDGT repeat protein
VHPAVGLFAIQAFLGQLYFIFQSYTPIGPISVTSIWRTDGSSAGMDFVTSNRWNTHTILGNKLIFDIGNNFPNGSGCSLHSFDGVVGHDTILWQGMPTGQLYAGSCPKVIGVMDHTLFFTLKMDSEELAVWKTDGTLSGTMRVKFLPSLISESVFVGPSTNVYNHSVIFAFDDGLHGAELWRTNGWDWGTEMLTDLQPVGAPDPLIGPVVGGKLLFVAEDDGVTGRELRTLRFKLENRLYGPVIGR